MYSVLIYQLSARGREWSRLGFDAQQLRRRPAQNGDAVGVAQPRRGEDEIHGGLCPRIRKIRAHDDLARSRLGHQVAHSLRREDDVVVVELPDILRGLLLELAGAAVRESQAALVG